MPIVIVTIAAALVLRPAYEVWRTKRRIRKHGEAARREILSVFMDSNGIPWRTMVGKIILLSLAAGIIIGLLLDADSSDVFAREVRHDTLPVQENGYTAGSGFTPIPAAEPEPVAADPVYVYIPVTEPEPEAAALPAVAVEAPEPQESESPYEGIFPYSSEVYLTNADIVMVAGDPERIQLAINEIYARKGYQFESSRYREYFSQFSWYVDRGLTMQQVEAGFNEYEDANIKRLASLRK